MDFSSKADRIEKMAQYWGAFLFCAVLVSCASSKPRGQVLPLHAGEMEPRKTARAEETVRVQEGYALSEGKGTSLPVPTNPEEAAIFYFGLGQAYSLDNEPAKAIESYRATLVHDPQSPLVRARLAAELVKVGNFAEAKVLCEEAVRLDPKYLDSYLLLAGIQVAAKEYDTAISTYRKVIAIDPKNRDALLYLGVTLADQKEYAVAQKEFEEAVKLDPRNAEVRNNLGTVLDEQGNAGAARTHLEAAVQLDPEYALAHNNLAIVLSKLGDKEAARVHRERAVALDPQMANTPLP